MPVRFDKSDELDKLFESFASFDLDTDPESKETEEAVSDKPDFSK